MQLRLVLLGQYGRGRSYALDEGQTLTVGREAVLDVQLGDEGAAGCLCAVARDERGAWLHALGGEWQVNGEVVGPGESRRLRPGDLLQVAGAQMRLSAHVEVRRAWLYGNSQAALRLARGLEASGDLGGLPVLADALEEAGCDDAELLAYC